MKSNIVRKNWIGKNFKEWCALDPDDSRKIHYTLTYIHAMQPVTEQFTTDDVLDGIYLIRLQNSFIDKIELIDNEWHITLSE